MADYPVGNRGTLRITDDGSIVRFYVLCSDPATNKNGYQWSGVINGVSVGGTINLPAGFGSRLLGEWVVSYSQTVSLSQAATGTSGLGGAAGFSTNIARATAPPAPTSFTPDQVMADSIRYRFSSSGTGGSPVTGWRAQCASDAAFTQNVQTLASNGTTTFTGLTPGTVYYFRSYGINAVGSGGWSSVVSARTLQQPAAPSVESTAPGQMRVAWVAPPGNLVSNVAGWDVEYADTPDMSGSTLLQLGASASPYTIGGQQPGQLMRVRVRARYADALGPWSPITAALLLSGVYVSDGVELDPGGVYASNGAQLAVAQVLWSDGGTLRPAL